MTTKDHAATQIVKFNFHGDELDVVGAADGEPYAVLARLCEPFGLDVGGQRRKLEALPWACWKIISAHDASGREQDLFCLHLRSLAGWLFTINAGKDAEPLRAKLAVYQRECADVLADHFLGRRGAAPPLLDAAAVASMIAASVGPAVERAVSVVTELYAGQLAELKAQIAAASAPSLGPAVARLYVLDPLREVARAQARALGAANDPKRVRRRRFLAARSLRERLAFPMVANARWAMFPRARLGEACCAVALMAGEARGLLDATQAKPTQLRLIPGAAKP